MRQVQDSRAVERYRKAPIAFTIRELSFFSVENLGEYISSDIIRMILVFSSEPDLSSSCRSEFFKFVFYLCESGFNLPAAPAGK